MWSSRSHVRIPNVYLSTIRFLYNVLLLHHSQWFRSCEICYLLSLVAQAFMLKRVAEEPLGHAAAIVADVLENAETNRVITASQKRALLHEMAVKLS